jgi:CubicO group peptidase (beta-lactamase class C family)
MTDWRFLLAIIVVLARPLPNPQSPSSASSAATTIEISATVADQDAPSPVPHATRETLAALPARLNMLTEKGFSGVVLIEQNGGAVFDQAFGSVNGKRVRTTDLFWIASISKSFTAAAVLRCREHHLIKIEDSISRYFSEVPTDKRSITVSQLLDHTSGLPQSYVSETIEDRDHAVKALLQEKLVSTPGTKFGYSNANYELLAAIVEIATGRKFDEYVRAEILDPLQLRHTGFWFDGQAKRVAPTREPLPARLHRRGWELGAGGMYSSAPDLLRWSNALRTEKILTHQSTALMFSDHVRISEGHAGFAWFHGSTDKGTELWFTRGNDSFGPNALIYNYPSAHATVVITSHSGDDQASETGWSRIALRELQDILQF